jgi:hypothetical protein
VSARSPLPRVATPPPLIPSLLPSAVATPGDLTPQWRYVRRYVINPKSADTSFLGDIPLPQQGLHAAIIWEAIDDTAATTATFGGMQIAVIGGALDTAAHYNWTDYSNANGGAPAGAGNATDTAFRAFTTTGGATGAQWRSKGRIEIQNYSDPSQTVKAFWETLQINSGTAIRRSGGGYYFGATGNLTRLRFLAGAGNLQVGTFFELWVAYAA